MKKLTKRGSQHQETLLVAGIRLPAGPKGAGESLLTRRWSIATALSRDDYSCVPLRAMVWPNDHPAQHDAKRTLLTRPHSAASTEQGC